MKACFVLFIVFMILKLLKVISWSWLWVTAPLWIGAIIFVIITISLLVGVILDNCL